MIIDSSALVAMVFAEPEATAFRRLVSQQPTRASVVSMVETTMVVEARAGELGGRVLRDLTAALELEAEPVTTTQAELAIAAWRRFGKGRHPARLNLGDCFAYALAKAVGEPLLFKGGNFAQTDIAAAL